jgi:hypothetical protein
MNITNTTILFIIIATIIYICFYPNQLANSLKKLRKSKKYNKLSSNKLITSQQQTSPKSSAIYNHSPILQAPIINSSFINIKYHQDYAHVISALNNLVPRVKTYFNIANIPMSIDCPELNEISDLIQSFMEQLNTTIKEEVTNFRQSNTGWDEQLPEPRYNSGWEKTQKMLGLVPSLYKHVDFKTGVKLIDVQNPKKYTTDDEVKYVADLIIQTFESKDQMSFKIGFTYNLRDAKNENNFFKKDVNAIMDIKIEDLFINGYYTADPNAVFNSNLEDPGNPEYEKYDILNNFNDFDNYGVSNNMTSPKYIQKLLLEKYKSRDNEMSYRTAMLDEEGRDYHYSLPKIYEYDNIHATQTIFDDMNCPKYYS